MKSHEVETIAVSIRARDESRNQLAKHLGYIQIKPPIDVGDKFAEVILGQVPRGIALNEVYSDSNMTLLVAEVDEDGSDTDREIIMLNTINDRVSTLVNDPSTAAVLAEQHVFQRDL